MLTVVLAGALAAPAPAVDPPEVYALAKVWPVAITLSAREYAGMQPKGQAAFPGFGIAPPPPKKFDDTGREQHRNTFGMELPWATGSVTIAGQTFETVGVRYKGNGTIGDAAGTPKKSFKIDLDKHGGAATFRGLTTLNLHCLVTDPTKLREALAYSIYRAAGVPAPRTAFAEVRLTVPGKHDDELLGFYTLTEPVDKRFLKDRFGSDKGLLMKPEQVREIDYLGEDWAKYTKKYAPRRDATDAEGKRVIAFAKLIHRSDPATFTNEIGSYLDLDGYLRFLAATAFVSNTDSFFALGHNYYLYLHPKTQRFHFIPWDVDRALANFPIFGSNNRQMDLSFTKPSATHKLTDRLFAMPGVKEQYTKLLGELAGTAFGKDRLLKEVSALESATKAERQRDAAAADARKDKPSPFNAMSAPPPALRTFVEKRTASLAAQLAGKSNGFVPGVGGFRMGGHMAEPLLANFDADNDGTLSRAEWLGIARRVYEASGGEKAGHVTEQTLTEGLNSMMPKPPEGSRTGPGMGGFMAVPIAKRADADKDGRVTLAELTAAAGKLFDEFDPDKSGKIEEGVFVDLLDRLFIMPAGRPHPGGEAPVAGHGGNG
jgi:spore coat protein CotH